MVAVTGVVRLTNGVCSTTACTLLPKKVAAWKPCTTTVTVPVLVPPSSTLAYPAVASRFAKPSSADGLAGVGGVVATMLPVIAPYQL